MRAFWLLALIGAHMAAKLKGIVRGIMLQAVLSVIINYSENLIENSSCNRLRNIMMAVLK